MKKILIVIVSFVCIMGDSFAQEITTTNFYLQARALRNIGSIPKDSLVTFSKFVYTPPITNKEGYTYPAKLTLGTTEDKFYEVTRKPWDGFDFTVETPQNLWDKNIILKVLPSIVKYDKGFQYDLRRESELDAIKYIQMVQNNGLILNDPFLESYIYSLVTKIAPKNLLDGRPSNVNIVIQQNPEPNACCYPNGTIVINSGLLASLHSEDELVAILSHEIAHFVLDHSMQNLNEKIKRQERAAFWAGLATVATAVVEGVAMARSDYYIPGYATIAVATLSTAIAESVNEQLGMEYNHAQEKEADALAVEMLRLLNYDARALSTALSRIEQIQTAERDYSIYLHTETHPALIGRIRSMGGPTVLNDIKYEQLVSFAVTNTAKLKYEEKRFKQSLPLVNQNITNGVATADDYILKANCILSTENTKESIVEVLTLLNKAKELDQDNINVYKAEIIAFLRLEQYNEALALLTSYVEWLVRMEPRLASRSDGVREFVAFELQWSRNMIVKLSGMI